MEKTEEFRRGKCKWFNVAKGWGFVTPLDGGQDVFVHQSVIQMGGFRSLADEEEVEFIASQSDKGLEATEVRGLAGGECKGSNRRPGAKKKHKKVRCYNCGEFANHLASQCNLDPMPKRCHHCKSPNHLIEDCPTLPEEKKRPSQHTPTAQQSKVANNGISNASDSVSKSTKSQNKTPKVDAKNATTSKPKKK